MARDCSITFTWADGDYTFRLKLGQLRELQEKCDAGPYELHNRFLAGTFRIDDIRETIRLGLIGGGKKPEEASTLVKRYVDDYPILDNLLPARAIMWACLKGVEDEKPGKAEAAQTGDESLNSQEANLDSPLSTPPEPL